MTSNQFDYTVRSFLAPVIKHLDDPEVSEIMINSPDEIWVEKNGRVEKTDNFFESHEALMSAVVNISQFVQRRINSEQPYMDARLPDGSRIHVILPPCARKGVCMSVRKFAADVLTINKLIQFGSLTDEAAKFLSGCVALKKNIIVSGGTGSGKTSLLNAISSLVPDHERIIVIEDSAELQLQQAHVLPLETKMADNQGRGEVTIRDLLKSTLRLRPDRIIIGEIRGGEALDLLQAMNTGHGGTMGTIHANSPLDALSRLETLSLFSGVELPLSAISSQIASAIDMVIQTSRYHDGSRKISYISEILNLDTHGNYHLSDIFEFKQHGIKEGKILGELCPTGEAPSFAKDFEMSGLELPQSMASQQT